MTATQKIVDSFVLAIVNPAIKFLFVLAFLIFLWGIFQFVLNINNEEAQGHGKKHLLWGLIGMFVMATAVAIVSLISRTVSTP